MRLTARLIVGLIVAALIAPAALASPSSDRAHSAAGRVVHVTYTYTGRQSGADVRYFYNPTSVFLPWALIGRTTFDVRWTVGCVTTKAFSGSARTVDLSCFARHWSQSGSFGLVDPFFPSRSCTGLVTRFAPPQTWGIGGRFTTNAGGALQVQAGLLNYNVVPICGNEALEWHHDPNIKATTRNLFGSSAGFDVLERDAIGDYGAGHDNAQSHSTLVVQLNARVVRFPILDQWAQQVAQYVTDLEDYLHESLAPGQENPGVHVPPTPTVFSATTGGMSLTVDDEDPVRLFSLHQQLRAGVPTQLHLRLTTAGRRLLAGLTDSSHLRITLAFTPSHARTVTVRKAITAPPIQPVISSVQFQGSPANPSIIVRGQGLGRIPAPDPAGSLIGGGGCPSVAGNYGSDFGASLSLADSTGNWAAGRHLPANDEIDCIGIVPATFGSGQIDLGLGSFYPRSQHALNPGDDVQIVVNGGFIDVHVQYGAPVSS